MFGRKRQREQREAFDRYLRKSRRLLGEVQHQAVNVVLPMIEDRIEREEQRQQRAFIEVAHMCGLTAEQIAAERGIPIDVVRIEFARLLAVESGEKTI